MRPIRRVSMCAMWASAAALAATLATQAARSAGVEDFYRGKTVSLLIGYSVGGGYDAYGRLVARHFGKHLPGNFNNRVLIDACIPYDKKLKGTFPVTVDVSGDLRKRLRVKFPRLFPKQ